MTKPELPLPSNTDVNSNKGVWKKISSRCWKTKPNAEKKRLYDTSNEELAKKIDQYNCLMDSAVQMSKLLDVSEATIKSLKEQQRRDTLTYQEELKLKENLIAILKVQNSSLKDSLLNHSCGKNLTPLKTEILPKLPAQQANYGLNQIKFDVSAITKQSGTFQIDAMKEDGLNPKSGLKVDASHYKTESSGTNIHPFYSNYKTDMNVMLQNQVHDKKCTTNSEKVPLQAFYSVPPRQFSLLKRESVPLISPKVISEDSTATIGQNDEMNLDLCLPDYMDDDDEVDQGCIIRSDNYNVEEREITLQSNDNVNFWGSKVTDLGDWNKLPAREINLPFGKIPFGNSNLEKQDISNLKQAFKPIMCDPSRSFKSLYNIEERPFCQGGSCVVYNGVSIGSATNQVIVKKVISFQHREDAISEMKILSKLRHSQIVTLLDYFIETDNIYLVFPKWGTLWINERHPSHSGYTLRHFLASKASAVTLVINGQLIELEIIFKIFSALIQAVEFLMSEKIVHNDLKLENILVNNTYEIKLIDFGLARQYKADLEKQFNTGVVGTNIAPEMHASINRPCFGKSNGPKLDWDILPAQIWALGSILFQMVMGLDGRLYDPTTYTPKYASDCTRPIPETLRTLLKGLLAHNPEDRIKLQEIGQCDWFKSMNRN